MSPLDQAQSGADSSAARPNRAPLMAFVTDVSTEMSLREGLEDVVAEKFEFRRAGIRVATAMLANMPTPLTLIVDLSGEQNPLAALSTCPRWSSPTCACWSWATATT